MKSELTPRPVWAKDSGICIVSARCWPHMSPPQNSAHWRAPPTGSRPWRRLSSTARRTPCRWRSLRWAPSLHRLHPPSSPLVLWCCSPWSASADCVSLSAESGPRWPAQTLLHNGDEAGDGLSVGAAAHLPRVSQQGKEPPHYPPHHPPATIPGNNNLYQSKVRLWVSFDLNLLLFYNSFTPVTEFQ